MGKLQRIICRLCLQKCVDYKGVEDYIKDVLDVLLLKINLAISEEPVMCTNCVAMTMRCFDFKATCFYTHDYIVPFLDNEKVSKLDLREVFISKHENVDIPDDHGICGFCMGLAKKCTAVSLDNKDVMLLKLTEEYLPELDLSTIEEPIICASCYESLKDCSHFVSSCLIVEERIKKYIKLTGAGIIEIADVLQLTAGKASRVEDNTNDVSTERKFCMDADELGGHENDRSVHLQEQNILLNEDIKIKTEHDFDRCLDVVSPQPVTTKSCGRKKQKICSIHKKAHNILDTRVFLCDLCSYRTKFSAYIRKHQHTTRHKNPSGILTYRSKCRLYQCNSCAFRTENETSLQHHMVTHRDPTMYQCDICSHRTKDKDSLETHMLTHKICSKKMMYQCYTCSFNTEYKIGLLEHMLIHKDPSDVTMYHCTSCSYEAKLKCHLKRHFLIPMGPSEMPTYQCGDCSFETKDKNIIKKHIKSHKPSIEIVTYGDDSCDSS